MIQNYRVTDCCLALKPPPFLGYKSSRLKLGQAVAIAASPYIRVGGRAKYRARDIEEYLSRHSGTSATNIRAAKSSSP